MSAVLMPLRRWLFLCLAFCSWLAVADVAVPTLSNRVTDLTHTLTPQQQQQIEQSLQAFEARKGSQIALLIVPSTVPETIEQYSMRVVEQWKLGRKGVDDGALLLVAKNDRTLRIEVGYGLEGALNDATCQRIISEIIVPQFKQGDFFGGIQAGLNRMMKVVDGEPLPPLKQNAFADNTLQALPVLFVVALIGGSILRALFGSLFGALITGGLIGFLAWSMTSMLFIALIAGAAAVFFTLISNNVGTGMGGGYYRGGSRGGGGFSGGGFGGGGGGFGGGGASGRW